MINHWRVTPGAVAMRDAMAAAAAIAHAIQIVTASPERQAFVPEHLRNVLISTATAYRSSAPGSELLARSSVQRNPES